jgi:hypothetical protein
MDPIEDVVLLAEELLDGEPEWLLPIKRALNHTNRRLHLMAVDISGLQAAVAELVTEDAAIEAAVTSAANELGSLASQVESLEAQVAAGGTATISQAEVDSLKASVEGVGTHLTTATTSLTAATTAAETPPAAPALPLYTHVGSEPIGASWTLAAVQTTAGEALYTFSGDTAGGQPTGASAEWAVYTGATQPVPAPAGGTPAAAAPAAGSAVSEGGQASPPGPDPSAQAAQASGAAGTDWPAGEAPGQAAAEQPEDPAAPAGGTSAAS